MIPNKITMMLIMTAPITTIWMSYHVNFSWKMWKFVSVGSCWITTSCLLTIVWFLVWFGGGRQIFKRVYRGGCKLRRRGKLWNVLELCWCWLMVAIFLVECVWITTSYDWVLPQLLWQFSGLLAKVGFGFNKGSLAALDHSFANGNIWAENLTPTVWSFLIFLKLKLQFNILVYTWVDDQGMYELMKISSDVHLIESKLEIWRH